MAWLFGFFFVSGFCSILYELIWLRLAIAQFGVTTALASIVLSVFMAGLGAGSWTAGVLVRRYSRLSFPPLRLYGLAELFIGISALTVPLELQWGNRFLENLANRTTLSSGEYYLVSGVILALTIIPWCACMGATIPLAMFAIRRYKLRGAGRSFSFLYISNLFGSIAGCSVPLFLIELFGFHKTLIVGSVLNFAIAASVFGLTLRARGPASETASTEAASAEEPAPKFTSRGRNAMLLLLFSTGFATMGMEVIWIRLYTPYVGPVVYSFALILASYLAATFAGSEIYRFWSRSPREEIRLMWASLAFFGFLPLLVCDPRVHMNVVARVFLGVGLFAGVIGFLTPMLVDRWSGGDPDRAGRGYAVNVAGCILGPLAASFLLLPLFGEDRSMLILQIPWLIMALPLGPAFVRPWQRPYALGFALAAFAVLFFTRNYETIFPQSRVLRDNTATVIATGEGMHKRLLVNGIGMTELTPITKMMAHMPLALLEHRPVSGLVICFGMGTSFRAMASWGIQVTAVELVPSVPKLFDYYHPDAQSVESGDTRIVVDDGRRYLERSPQTYDVILIDPPPPITTAGSSLLYSQDFYTVAKRRLRPGGILAQWLPYGDAQVTSSVARALKNSFPYVRVYTSITGWGLHFFAAMDPLPERTPPELVSHMPAKAVADLMEWGPEKTPEGQFGVVLSRETQLDQLTAQSPATPALQDDRPINEYFLLRRYLH